MKFAAFTHYFYNQLLIKLLRIGIFIVLLVLILPHTADIRSAKVFLFLLSLFLMNEVYIHYSLNRIMPKLKAQEATEETLESAATIQAMEAVLGGQSGILSRLLSFPQIQFFLQKAVIAPRDIQNISLDMHQLLLEAGKHAIESNGVYITTADLLAAYLILSEEKTKLLFNKKLKPEDIQQIAYWTRLQFKNEETQKKNRVNFWGEGIGQPMVSGWTLETRKYTQDFSGLSINTTKLLRGREKEYGEMQEVLAKKESNNIILTGATGAGKETLVEILAADSFAGALSSQLNYKRILELLVGSLLAGVSSRGELQQRLELILQEVSHSGDIILYIPEFQNVLGASSFGLDISDVLIPYLRNGKMPIIATMSTANYKNYMEKSALKEDFTMIAIPEPDRKQAMDMLFGKVVDLENKYSVEISYEAVVSAVDLAGKYVVDTVLPGNAVILLEDSANAVSQKKGKVVMPEDIIAKVESKTNIKVGTPGEAEKNVLLHLEETLHKRVVGQDGAISAIGEAVRRVRTGIASQNKPISFLFLGPTGVGKTETAKALASVYFGNEDNMIRIDMSEYADAMALTKLLGTPDGSQRGALTEPIHDKPFSLVLLDEFEKANQEVLDLFLQVLDDGRLTDTQGKTVSFANAIIIATSNAGSEVIREAISQGVAIDATFQSKLLDALQQKAIFKPELLNRFDAIIAFKSLTQQEVEQVVDLLLAATVKKLAQQDITISFDPMVRTQVAKQGYDVSFGARPLRRFIQDKIEDLLAKKILAGEIARGAVVKMGVGPTGEIVISP